MLRYAVAALALIAYASAMPSDLPWEGYDCAEGKTVNVKFLSDGLTIAVLFGADEAKDPKFDLHPISEEHQAGFKMGPYRAEEGTEITLLLSEDGTFNIVGPNAPNGPYDACKANGKTIGGG